MGDTIVIQSSPPGPAPDALSLALESVAGWASACGFTYQHIHDELFDYAPAWCLQAAGPRKQMAADVARLGWIRKLLDDDWARVVWIDADVLAFDPERLSIDVPAGYGFGREIWIQTGADGKQRVYRNVHNAFLVFTATGRTTLEFYRQTALKILKEAGPTVPAQLIGPKLLTALHNVAGFPLLNGVGMASPLVLRDLAAGGGAAWECLRDEQGDGFAAINLCASLLGSENDGVFVNEALMADAVRFLLRK